MHNHIHIICHPGAGSYRGQRILNQVTDLLETYHATYLTYLTDHKSHARLISQQIGHKYPNHSPELILVIGGDGTLHEVIEALFYSPHKIPVAFIPAGTGNDFARARYQTQDLDQMVRHLLYPKQIRDLPIISYQDNIHHRQGVILNNMGYGLDAQVNYQAERLQERSILGKLANGSFTYLGGLVKSLHDIQLFDIHGQVDQEPFAFHQCGLVSIMNSPLAGGGLCLADQVDALDPLLSLVTYHNINSRAVWDCLRRVLITKDHHQSDYIKQIKGNQLNLSISYPVWGHEDGEIIPAQAVDITCQSDSYPFIYP